MVCQILCSLDFSYHIKLSPHLCFAHCAQLFWPPSSSLSIQAYFHLRPEHCTSELPVSWKKWSESVIAQSCPTLWCSSVHGILRAENTGVSSHSLLQGTFPTQGSNLSLLHCGHILYYLSHQGVFLCSLICHLLRRPNVITLIIYVPYPFSMLPLCFNFLHSTCHFGASYYIYNSLLIYLSPALSPENTQNSRVLSLHGSAPTVVLRI